MSAAIDMEFDVFCWWELGTTDVMAAKEFYDSLFQWNFVDTPMPPEGVYTVMQVGDKNVAGLYRLKDVQTAHNVPPHWLSYISVRDVDSASAKAEQLGGVIQVQPFDVADIGRMSVMQDPTGAVFALWQSAASSMAMLMNKENSVCWNELFTRDMIRAREFYTALLGWSAQEMLVHDHPYVIFKKGEQQVASMMELTPEMHDAPPHWMLYLCVSDCMKTVETAKARGAEIFLLPTDIPGAGQFAVLQDPQGAVFSIIQKF